MPTVLDWNPTVDPLVFVRTLREALAAGSLVVIPGDVGYVVLVNPSNPSAHQQLQTLSKIADAPPAILTYDTEDPSALGLAVTTAARRLMIRAWPAPLIVALPAEGAALPSHWPLEVQQRVIAGGCIRFRCPDHPLFEAVFPALEGVTLVVDTFLPTAEAVIERLGSSAEVVVSAGELDATVRPTLVRVNASGWQVQEPGAMDQAEIEKLTANIVLFVCTGNTCRSPLAEGLAKKLLAERLGCEPEELPARGFWVLSAGVAAYGGGPATPESAEVAQELGVSLDGHRSRPVNPQLLAAADHVVAMTQGHVQALEIRYPGIGPGAQLLCGEEQDLDDPIGAGLDVYRECARIIAGHLERFIPEWVGS